MNFYKHSYFKAFMASFCIHLSFTVLLIGLFLFRTPPRSLVQNTEFAIAPIGVKPESLRINQRINEQKSTISEPNLAAFEANRGGASEASGAQEYAITLRNRIAAHQIYPILARKKGLEGEVPLVIELNDDGSLARIESDLEPKKAQKLALLVEAAIESVRRASPFLPPPAGKTHVFRIPIIFAIQ